MHFDRYGRRNRCGDVRVGSRASVNGVKIRSLQPRYHQLIIYHAGESAGFIFGVDQCLTSPPSHVRFRLACK